MIQVIHRAIDILEYVAKDPEKPKLLGQIASDLNLNLATCANIVKTLSNRGLLKKAINQKGYLIGNQIQILSENQTIISHLIELASNEMAVLSQKLNENCLLAILKNDNRIVVYKKDAEGQLVQATTPDKKNAYDSSTGRLLLAMLSDEDLKKYIKQYGLPSSAIWKTVDTYESLINQVSSIRKRGYALLEDSVQVVGIATPIYYGSTVIASLSVYLPAFRFDDEFKEKMILSTLQTADRISKSLNI
jgi:IclR family KDG regulon transcriptional repressor